MGSREKREERRSLARRRAERHSSGFETTVLKVPEGCGGFFELKEGIHNLDIVPYTVGKGNPEAEPGETYYERTFWSYKNIGVEEKSYVAPGKTFGKPDPIAEFRSKAAKKSDADPDYIKLLAPKERQVFLVWDRADRAAGVKLWEISFHNFGKLLDSRLKNSSEEDGWDLFYFPDLEGSTLRITVEETSMGTFKFNKVTAIDFIPRKKPLPEEIVNHGICLDDLLVELPYEKLKAIFMAVPEADDVDEDDDDDEPAPKKSKGKPESKKKSVKAADDDLDDDDDDEPAPKKSSKPAKKAVEDDDWDEDDDDEPAPKKSKAKPVEDDGDDDDDEPAPKKKPAAKKPKFAVDDEVTYKGEKCRVARISGDGTSLTLSDSEDELIRAVDPDDCEPYVAKKKAKPAVEDDDDDDEPAPKKKSKKAPVEEDDDDDEPAPKKKAKAKAKGDDDDEEWDKGWDDDE